MKRFESLDVFRGLTIAAMILVNTPGSWSHVYPPLLHAKWHGCTPTDLVFPFFLFIVGVAMYFSFSKYNYELSRDVGLKVLRRVLLIFAIGLALNAFPFRSSLADLRIPGVLQRIAIAYGLASITVLYLKRERLIYVIASLLLGYWLLLRFGVSSDPYALESNLVRSVDLALLGEGHVYGGFGIPFDPEGILSTLPAVATALIGYLTGYVVRSGKENVPGAIRTLLLSGASLVALGLVWGQYFPINKPIWTSSYVVYTAGIAQLMLALFVWAIDVKGLKAWTHPFKVFGMNSLFAYMLSSLWVQVMIYWVIIPKDDGSSIAGYNWLYENVFRSVANPINASLLFAIVHVIAIWLVLLVLYRRKVFIKV